FTTLRSSYLSHPNYRGEIKCAGKRSYMLKRKITAFKPYKVPLLPTKKAVLLKNCFVYLNSKNDNSIDCQKSSRRFRSTGFHCWLFKPNESLVIRRSIFISIFLNPSRNKVYIQFCRDSFHKLYQTMLLLFHIVFVHHIIKQACKLIPFD